MTDVPDNGDIRYTVKEVLARIEGKLDVLAMQIQQKADVSQVTSLDARLNQMERDMQEGKETVKSMLIPDYHLTKGRLEDLSKSFDNLKVKIYALLAFIGLAATGIEVWSRVVTS